MPLGIGPTTPGRHALVVQRPATPWLLGDLRPVIGKHTPRSGGIGAFDRVCVGILRRSVRWGRRALMRSHTRLPESWRNTRAVLKTKHTCLIGSGSFK